jgi:hypothetical protein
MKYSVTYKALINGRPSRLDDIEHIAKFIANECSNIFDTEPSASSDFVYDYQWNIRWKNDRHAPSIMVGRISDNNYEWILQIESNVGWFSRLIGKSDTVPRDNLTLHIAEILKNNDMFTDIRWHQEYFADEGWSNSPEE